MTNIKLMSENLANKIAAGEIIERPLSVVKELVENAIDADASQITIELKEAGITQIKVIDNGKGMNAADLALCTKRHATSKIYSDQDLFKISTLGFRGEALASIFAVSKFEIISSDGENGNILIKLDDESFNIKPIAANKGTVVIIKNLFYNTPARYKHLSSPFYELSIIINYINKLALTMPQISFKIINDEKVVLHTFGNGDVKSAIAQIYSPKLASKMIELELVSDNFKVSGFTSHPNDTRSKKSYITLAINGRIIRNYDIENAIIEGYGKFLHTNQFPISILNIELDYALVDVNIHPTKQQVKISLIEELLLLIRTMLDKKMKSLMYIAFDDEITSSKVMNLNESNYKASQTTIKSTEINPINQDNFIDDSLKNISKHEIEKFDLFADEEVKMATPRLPKLEYIGALKNTYLLFQNEDGLYLLDQHAAQERINYEIIYKKFVERSFTFQQLLTPFTIEMTANDYLLAKNKICELEKLGIILEEFGPNTFKISEVDNFYFKANNLKTDVEVLLDRIIKEKSLEFAKIYEDIAILMACKGSIKANHYLERNEIEKLINDLNAAEHPYTCPHGRPVIVNISFGEIEKMFKRIFG